MSTRAAADLLVLRFESDWHTFRGAAVPRDENFCAAAVSCTDSISIEPTDQRFSRRRMYELPRRPSESCALLELWSSQAFDLTRSCVRSASSATATVTRRPKAAAARWIASKISCFFCHDAEERRTSVQQSCARGGRAACLAVHVEGII